MAIKKNIWKKKEYIDLWSLNHFLDAALVARILLFVDLSFWLRLLIAFIVMIAWELWEILGNIEESIQNKIIDAILGAFGFFIMYYLYIKIEFFSSTVLFVVILVVCIFLNLWGYATFLKKTKRLY